ncbi:6593_t:CDS:2 [Funneliformis caledonium]|uniref:6593_t:CDS:1 n=1 Tax=Funneliformis caledonium TaxID=1117310 RepID=A0A9N8YRG8_9GLOM|nr:6593_t:CDS:2 [Funneliformis caledonium]
MDLPIYDGNIHPNEWLKQIQTYCFLKKITKDEEILKFAIMMIDSTINIPEKLTSLDELINALKQDHIPEAQGGETSKFINTFRRLCFDAEINNLREQKKYLYESLSNNDHYLKSELYKKMENVNSISELMEEFRNVFIDESNLIRHGSIIALKHAVTGKYLSSIKGLNYTTGSKNQLIFANNLLDSNALWKITFSGNELTSYTNTTNIYLKHKNSGYFLGIYYRFKSPVTQHSEVSCNPVDSYHNTQWKFNNSKLENDQGYLKSNDIINLSNKNYNGQQVVLRSHDFQFTIGNNTFQEVVCHNERLGGNDEWCIELIE